MYHSMSIVDHKTSSCGREVVVYYHQSLPQHRMTMMMTMTTKMNFQNAPQQSLLYVWKVWMNLKIQKKLNLQGGHFHQVE
jgi:hypothetical protein